MRIVLALMADVLVLVAALLAVNEYHALRRRRSFTVPFTDKLIARGIIAPARRDALLREDLIVHAVGIGIAVAAWAMLSAIFAGVGGWVLFPVAAGALAVFWKPDTAETDETRGQYYRAHKNDIDDLKFHEYLQSVSGGAEKEAEA